MRASFPPISVEEAWQYDYINGKLATLRWVLGSERDFLDPPTSQTAGFVSALAGHL